VTREEAGGFTGANFNISSSQSSFWESIDLDRLPTITCVKCARG
jgi:hypothetical protein